MIRLNNHLKEEQIIDYIEGVLSEEQNYSIKYHLNNCQACQKLYQSWKVILNNDNNLNETDVRRVWNGLQEDIVKANGKQQIKRRRIMYAAWIASSLFFLIIGYMFGYQNNQSITVLQDESEKIESFVNEPVEHYNMISSNGGERQGVAWYNPINKQMILLLNDPNHINQKLQEIQIETENRIIPIKPNHLNDGKIQFYVRDQYLQDLMQLILIPEDNDFRQTYYFEMAP